MRVAIVHDDLVQWGGAERVLGGLTEIYPDAPIYTSVFDYSNNQLKKRFANKKIITSFLQKIPGWKSMYKALLPLYPIAFEQFNFDEYDLVISHTTRFAKSIITKPQTKHICYCHTPPRFLWHFSGYGNLGWAEILMTKLRLYDQVAANRVDFFLAGSENAKRRIKKIYKRESTVLYPFIDDKRFENIEPFDGGYFLVISRLNKYKKIDLAIQACNSLGFQLKVIGVGPQMESFKNMETYENVEMLGNLSDEMVVKVLAGCRALIIPGEEDFGLASLEAQALGKPVVAFAKGGNLETIIDETSGILFKQQTVESLTEALGEIDKIKFDPAKCRANAERFSKSIFMKQFSQILAKLGYTI